MATKPETANGDDVDAAKAPAKKKTLVLVLGLLFLILALAAGGWFYLAQKNAAHADDEPAHVTRKGPPTFLPLDNMVVNLADAGGEKVAQIGLTLELVDSKAADTVKLYLPTIRSSILLLVSQRTSEELLLIEGKEKLADDILLAAMRPLTGVDSSKGASAKKKGASDDDLIRAVHFSSFIVQ